MRKPVTASQFKRDVKAARRRGKDRGKLRLLMTLLIEAKPLPASYHDHALRGRWHRFRDAHIEPDWLLIYKVDGDIAASSNPGDIVLDPFAGCGATCFVSEKLGRQWVGIDIDPEAENETVNLVTRQYRCIRTHCRQTHGQPLDCEKVTAKSGRHTIAIGWENETCSVEQTGPKMCKSILRFN